MRAHVYCRQDSSDPQWALGRQLCGAPGKLAPGQAGGAVGMTSNGFLRGCCTQSHRSNLGWPHLISSLTGNPEHPDTPLCKAPPSFPFFFFFFFYNLPFIPASPRDPLCTDHIYIHIIYIVYTYLYIYIFIVTRSDTHTYTPPGGARPPRSLTQPQQKVLGSAGSGEVLCFLLQKQNKTKRPYSLCVSFRSPKTLKKTLPQTF